ncbi:ABC transporter permease [Amycolatopsis sp. NPDC058986]|uniref:ABC transporter permease n=1 Tax=unclassified Amycolatopsis TaxID=2618356 RepID=UPI00366AE98E
MLRLALRTLRLRKGGFLATFVAVFFGAVLVSACAGLMETGIRSEAQPQRLAGAPIVIGGQQSIDIAREDPAEYDATKGKDLKTRTGTLPERVRLDAGLVDRVRSVPGVTDAVAEVSFPVTLPKAADVLGHAWNSATLTPYALTSGTAPAPGEVVLDAGLARNAGLSIGDRIDVAAHGSASGYRVAGIAAAPRAMTQSALFFASSDAERLSGHPGRVDAIGVFATRDVDAVAARVNNVVRNANAVVLTGVDRGQIEFPEANASGEKLIVLSAVTGGLSVTVAIFVVASTLALSTQQRQRELALLRAIGTTPRQLRRMVLGEALVVGLLATALAAVLGPLVGGQLFEQLVANDVVPSVVAFHQGWLPAVVASGAALLSVVLASVVAGYRAGRIRPTEALAESAVTVPIVTNPTTVTAERLRKNGYVRRGGRPTFGRISNARWVTPTRVILGALCFAGGTALAIVTVAVMSGPVAASTAGPAVMLWAIGVATISPGVTKVTAALLHAPVKLLSGINGWMALRNTRVGALRVSGAVTPIMLAVGIATGNIYLQTTQEAVSNQAFTEDLRADAVVSGPGGVAPELVRRVQDVPGVAGASEYVTSSVYVEKPYESGQNDEGWPVVGLTAKGAAQTTATQVTAGGLDALSGNTVAVPAKLAADLGRGVGDSMTLRLGDGARADVRIVALLTQRPGFENFVLPAELVAPHTTAGLAPQLLVRAAPGVDTATLTTRVREATTGFPVRVGDRDALIAAHTKGNEVGAWVNYLLVGMIMAYTVISVVNTLVMATMRRRREFGLQRLSGFTRAQVLRMAGIEGGLTAFIGIVLGTVVAAGSIVPFCLVASDSLLPSGPVSIYLVVIGLAAALVLAATFVPAWFATRGRPAEATAIGE